MIDKTAFGWRRRRPDAAYWRDIVLVLAIKLAALAVLYFAVVVPLTRAPPTSRGVSLHLLGDAAPNLEVIRAHDR